MRFRTRNKTEATAAAKAIGEARLVARRALGESHAELHNDLHSLEHLYWHEAAEHERAKIKKTREVPARKRGKR
jgi:hypothetical protein